MQIDVNDISIYDDFNNVNLLNVNDDADNFSIYNKPVKNNEATVLCY
ncbi:9239_t:CDS:2 [Funneliformis caledonium]|uniref:9239_t:CDS:1 n=1 Tax=Funneliformis caledonium TaxID=1117310 RepID=A0A9N8WLB0_9GLOM|nr:9239_t:CDS:2 [Funneliformis caledonium]